VGLFSCDQLNLGGNMTFDLNDPDPENPLRKKTHYYFHYPSWIEGFSDLSRRIVIDRDQDLINTNYLYDLGVAVKYIMTFLIEGILDNPKKGGNT